MKTCAITTMALLAVLALMGRASAIVISTFDHNGDGVPSGNGADTWIDEDTPTYKNGNAAYTCLRNQPNPDGSGKRYQELVYVRFDLSALDKASFVDAKLQWYDYRFNTTALMAGKEFSVWALQNESLDNWGETAINWENAPGHSNDSLPYDDPDFNNDAVFLGRFTFAQESANGWNVPVAVPGLMDLVHHDTNGLITLMITGPVGPNTLFYTASKETVFDRLSGTGQQSMPAGALAPRLVLTIPEPATAWLVLVGLGLLLCPIRRCLHRA